MIKYDPGQQFQIIVTHKARWGGEELEKETLFERTWGWSVEEGVLRITYTNEAGDGRERVYAAGMWVSLDG